MARKRTVTVSATASAGEVNDSVTRIDFYQGTTLCPRAFKFGHWYALNFDQGR